MVKKKGKFIVLEAGEGAGKDTQIDLLKETFSREEFVFTREPGGTEIGERIRDLILADASIKMTAETELLLFVAARAQLIQEIIKPNLEQGRHVISNRFGLSTIAYQIYGRNRESLLPLLREINRLALNDLQPDLYIFLDVTPEVGLKRTLNRVGQNNRLDAETLDFHQRVYRGFHEALADQKHVIIDGLDSVGEINQKIKQQIDLII